MKTNDSKFDNEHLSHKINISNKDNKQINLTNNISRKDKETYGKNFQESINIFNKLTETGPIYVCSICQQTNFIENVKEINKLRNTQYIHILNDCNTHYKSVDNKEYICNPCKKYIYKGKIPKLSIKNGCGFNYKPNILNLFPLEECYISPIRAFMLIRQLSSGGQYSMYGNVCHIPIEIGKLAHTLPNNLIENDTITVKLKRRLCYKNSVLCENIRPNNIIQALKYLLDNSKLYKQYNINIDKHWLQNFSSNNNRSCFQLYDKNKNNINHTSKEEEDEVEEEEDNDETPNAPSINTLLTDKKIDNNINIICIAPGEGQKPIFTDDDTEYLCFPTIFCGQRRNENKYHRLHKTEIFKYEICSIDTRVSTNIPNIFWKTKYKQIQQIKQKVSFALRRNQRKGHLITAETLLNKETREKIVKLNDGYNILKTIRNSPPYFELKKKNLMAMIRQLGIPTLFFSLSSADTKWINLLKSIKQIVENITVTDDQINNLTWYQKCKMISDNPAIPARFFNNRVKKFIKYILKSPHSPFGKLQHYFYRVEFQHRGSPHIHGLLWINNVPHYDKSSESEICKYIDTIITCSHNIKTEHKQYLDLQSHKHTKTCIKKINKTKICRFNAPWPPIENTKILHPLDDEHLINKDFYMNTYNKINQEIQYLYKTKTFLTIPQLLQKLNISYEHYILALRSSIKKRKIFLQRSLSEIYTNNYMKNLIHVWKANHDIQYVLDPYSCVVYICDYLIKSNKGMSKLLETAAEEARKGNMDIKQSVRHIGNKFLNCSEMSEQECIYDLLELPITQSSVKVEFISTCEKNDRVFLAKKDHLLRNLEPESQDIHQESNIDKYKNRPKQLEHLCLADYVSLLDISYIYSYKESDDNESVNEESSDDEKKENNIITNELTTILKTLPIKLSKNKILKLRKQRKVIRFVNYKYKIDSINYCREKLLLYIPWRNEEKDLFHDTNNYIEAYNKLQKEIEEKMKIYEPAAQIIDNAILDYEQNPEQYIPANTIINSQTNDEELENDFLNTYQFLNPSTLQETYEVDIQDDLKIRSYNYIDSVQIKNHLLSNNEYYKVINQLNEKQYLFYLHIMHKIFTNQQELTCLHGGAGTGKSFVIKAIHEGIHRALESQPGNISNINILLAAPTGKAAFNIKGNTIHSAFHIPANQSLANYSQLSYDTLNTLRCQYNKLKWIIFDEISMVSNNMLRYIHLRLQDIKQNNQFFGGVNVVAVGDFYQLKPVKGNFIFEDYKEDYGPLATNIWYEKFKIFELTEIMRQKDDRLYAELLNRLRVGTYTKKDIQLLKQTKKTNNHLNSNSAIPHFFPTREQVNSFNDNIIQKSTYKIISKCSDVIPTSISKLLFNKIEIAISKKQVKDTGGLSQEIILATDQQYDIINNIDVKDGLINGTECTIKYIQCTNDNENQLIPTIIWVVFEDENIGIYHRSKYSYLYLNKKINRKWTPILKIKRSFLIKDVWIHRIQFPLKCAAARTIHISQSSTYKQIHVDLNTISNPPKFWWQHMHYVALSRVISIKGLYVENLNEENICVSSKVLDYLKYANKKKKLHITINFFNPDHINISFNNSRSFKKNYSIIKENKIINLQDINIFCETKLTQYDENKNYQLNKNIIIRLDQRIGTKIDYGIIAYINPKIKINNIDNLSIEKLDILLINISYHNNKITLLSLYNSPKNDYTYLHKHLNKILINIFKTEKHVIIVGDFNINITSANYLKLTNLFKNYKMTQHISDFTTKYQTTIDLLFSTNNIHSIQVLHAHWSDHNIIHFQLKL